MNVETQAKPVLTGSSALLLRGFSFLVGLVFVAWAFSDDVRIVGGPGFGVTQAFVLVIGLLNIIASILRIDWLIGLIVCQASVGVTLIAAELLLRAALYPRYYSPYQLESSYLYNLIPDARREYRLSPGNDGEPIMYEVNSLGFRGKEFPLKRSAKPRIAVYGDSFIHAEFSSLEKTFVSQLEGLLSEQVPGGIEVVNAGISGYGPDQILKRLENELEWLQPDLLIVSIFSGNDFGDLVRNKLFRVTPDGDIEENAFSFSDEIILNEKLSRSELILKKMAKKVRDSLLRRINEPELFDPAQVPENGLSQHLAEYKEYVLDRDNVVRELRVDPYSSDISLLPGSPSAEYKLKLMNGVIGRITATANTHDIPLLLLIIPHPMDALGGAHDSGVVNKQEYPDYQPSRLVDSVEEIAGRHEIESINLYPPFRDADDPAALYLKAGDDHWNNAGQRYAAEIVAQFLLDTPEMGQYLGLSR